MAKFQRTYTMEVQGRSGKIHKIEYPLTLVINITRRAWGSLNSGNFMVYNLSAATRKDIQFDYAIDAGGKEGKGASFNLRAGYISEGYLPIIFKGTLQSARSYREGPNVITEIDALDGGDAVYRGQTELTRNFPLNPINDVGKLISSLNKYGVTLGALGTIITNMKSTRGVTWIGSTFGILKKIAKDQGGYACIDMEKVYMMADNDVLIVPGAIPRLDSSTGMIGTPRRSGWTVDAQMLFEPRIQLNQQLEVRSEVAPDLNGKYRLQVISHRGIISGAKDGGVITALGLLALPETMNELIAR